LHSKLKLDVTLESWQMTAPLRISGYIMQDIPVLVVGLSDGSFRGRGEAAGVFYLGDWPADMLIQVEAVRGSIEAGISREALRELLPAGGARNAVDCALWELESMQAGMSVERLAGVEEAGSLLTTCTIGADSPLAMAHVAVEKYRNAKALKLKLLGDDLDAPRVCAVRKARPDVWLGVDGNQGFSVEHLAAMQPALMDARVSLIEQPFKVGQEALLDGFDRPIPIAADESVQSLPDMAVLAGRFDAVNIKLDKCGGLTEALLMMAEARRLGLKVMVGNMGGTSLAMAPAMVIGSGCDIVDLDGPLFLTADRVPGVVYRHGMVSVEPGTWGWCRPA
jgi:L-Ala-D/L-Glu epimerase